MPSLKKSLLLYLMATTFVLYGCQNAQSQNQQLPNHQLSNTQTVAKETLFDESKWQITTKKSTDLEGNGIKEDVYLLKTIQPVGKDGTGSENEYGVKIIIAQNNKKLFEFTPSEMPRKDDDAWPLGYYPRHAEDLEKIFFIDPIQKDGEAIKNELPHVIFQTEINGAADSDDCYHILYFNVATHTFASANRSDFCEKNNIGVMFEQVIPGRIDKQAILSLPANGEISWWSAPQPYYLTVYKWTGNQFTKDRRFPNTEANKYEDGPSAVEGEIENVKAFYKKNL